MLSIPKPILKAFVRKFLHFERMEGQAPQTYRAAVERFVLPKPLGVRVTKVAGRPVRGEWLSPLRPKPGECLLYLHGGAYVFGSCATHREFAGRLARITGRKVFLLEYRLAPEHPFPAAHDDAVAAYEWLRAQGYSADKIVILGDSAGGGLALSTVLGLRDRGLPLPAGLALFSPWVDLTRTEAPADICARDPMVHLGFGNQAARAYYGKAGPEDPLVSPQFGDLRGLPPMLIQVGSEEILLDQGQVFAAKAKKAGVEVELQVWDTMWHVWQLFALVLPEAREAHRDIARFVTGRLAN